MAPAHPDRTAAVVLAGGGARRFGSDKTTAVLAGRSLLERVLDAVAPVVDEVVVVGPWAPAPYRHLAEDPPGRGPLAGLVAGWGAVRAERTLALAADHPFLRSDLLEMLITELGGTSDAALQERRDAVVPVVDGRAQPLVAAYRCPAAASAGRHAIEVGERSMRAVLDRLDVRWLPEERWRSVDAGGASFLDVDHPEDLLRMERSAPELDELDGLADLDVDRPGSEHRQR